MDLQTASQKHWNVIVIGTGIGGATLGWALAKAGRSVLFLERGWNLLGDERLVGNYAEMLARETNQSLQSVLPLAGRWNKMLTDLSKRQIKQFTPFIGMGTGGSSTLYGAALERFFPEDFEPGRHYTKGQSTLPETWPIDYDDMRPWYRKAERLYEVYGETDPLRYKKLDPLAEPPPLDETNQTIANHLQYRGLHPYRLPSACREREHCQECQGFLCPTGGKRDSATVCLTPAVCDHHAALVNRCTVERLEAGATTVHSVVCRDSQSEARVHGDLIVLAAGALHTPALLLRSASNIWPRGLANGSGEVGANLMRHAIDLYLVRPPIKVSRYRKQLAFNDNYLTDVDKLGSVQSFGMLPPLPMMLDSLKQDLNHASPWLDSAFPLLRPILERVLRRMTRDRVIFAGILEDLPYERNRVELTKYGGVNLHYQLSQDDRRRLSVFRRKISAAFAPWPVHRISQADNNERIAHVCGTCRFGDNPESSVLDRWNRAHQLDNLYVADASFFPSSAGINPALTIAANALRVADHLLNQ